LTKELPFRVECDITAELLSNSSFLKLFGGSPHGYPGASDAHTLLPLLLVNAVCRVARWCEARLYCSMLPPLCERPLIWGAFAWAVVYPCGFNP
jgi:hypothetical protein